MERLGIMQPYFFPYIGYFSLIKHTDKFILLDEVQFIRHGWIERNRILKQTGGWQYIAVPLKKHTQKTRIKDIEINNSQSWKKKIIDQIGYYRKAPYYKEIKELLEKCFAIEYSDITHLNKKCLEEVCCYIGITTPIEIFSEMGIEIEPVTKSDEWALNICLALDGVKEYWNPPGGRAFFDTQKYKDKGIDLKFQEIILSPYMQNGESIMGLSIIDVLMFNSIEKVKEMLEEFYLYE